MPRSVRVYGPRTSKEVAREVKNFNARRAYEIRKNPDAETWLPEKASVKTFKRENTSRADVNAGLAELRAFKREKLEPVFLDKGLVKTKWEIEVVQKHVEQTNRSRAQRLRAIKPSLERGTSKAAEQLNLMPMAFDPNKLTADDFARKKTAALKESRRNFAANQAADYKQQYLQNIENMGQHGREILKMIRDLPPSAFIQAYKLDPVLNIKFTSDPLRVATIAAEIRRHWSEFLGLADEAGDEAWEDEDEDED